MFEPMATPCGIVHAGNRERPLIFRGWDGNHGDQIKSDLKPPTFFAATQHAKMPIDACLTAGIPFAWICFEAWSATLPARTVPVSVGAGVQERYRILKIEYSMIRIQTELNINRITQLK